MPFTLTVTTADWTDAGASPGVGHLTLEFYAPVLGTTIYTTADWKLKLNVDGTGSWEIPTVPAGNALRVTSRITGLYTGRVFLFADPGTGTHSLTHLIQTCQVDEGTLQPITAAPTVAEELARLEALIGTGGGGGGSSDIDGGGPSSTFDSTIGGGTL